MNKQQNWFADRWQQSFQQQFIMALSAINVCARVYKHQTQETQL